MPANAPAPGRRGRSAGATQGRQAMLGKVAAAVAAATFIVTSIPALAQDKIRWKMQSAFGSQLPHLGPPAIKFTKDIEAMTGGKFEIKFFEPGALIPPLECFDAVSKGSIESCWTTPGYHTGKYPVLAFFTTVPFGPSNIGEFLAWKWHGGGNVMRDEIYAKHGLKAIEANCIGPETSGWFRKEVKGAEDMKGLKMRFFGLGARVMEKLGVSTQLLAAADIFPALERGVIDATEFSMPTMDIQLGFHQIAKFNYFPGWHQQVSCGELLVNQKTYDALPEPYKRMLEVTGRSTLIWNFAETEASQFAAMQEMQKKHNVQVRRWSDADLAAYEKAWLEVITEDSAKDPLFKKVADHYLEFRKKYSVWGDSQAMKPTYLRSN
jgi:TRAP-type mannitol/chloroaromatic compound transport system substrate-binding protein